MSRNARREEKRAQWAIEQEVFEMEERRRANRTMFEVIEEDIADGKLRAILHRMAEGLGLE